MPTDGKKQTYGFLDRLSTEQLLNLIQADFESSEPGDEDLIIRILEVIEKREKEDPTGILSDVDQAWEDFQTYYTPPDGTGRPLYPMRDPDLTAVTAAAERSKTSRGRGRLLRRLVPVAAVVAVTFSSMIAAQAFGFDVFGALARWTSETFHFDTGVVLDPVNSESEALQKVLQETFDDYGVTIPAPTWYPKGTELVGDIDVTESPSCVLIACEFICDGNKFYIEAQQYYEDDRVPGYTLEKDASDIEEYSSNGRQFYIMSNLSKSNAVYSDAQTVMVIDGELSLEALKQIIDSIGA